MNGLRLQPKMLEQIHAFCICVYNARVLIFLGFLKFQHTFFEYLDDAHTVAIFKNCVQLRQYLEN